MADQNIARYVSADTGPSYWGPGDRYTFLVTGAQSDGAYFIMEAIVPPGGGPPPHIHRREQESFYVLEGTLDIQMGDQTVHASAGDFVHIPIGMVHSFRNNGDSLARQLVIFSPGGLEWSGFSRKRWRSPMIAPPLPPTTSMRLSRAMSRLRHGTGWNLCECRGLVYFRA